jgi:hypothetical protein
MWIYNSLRPNHTAQKSRKRMNCALISSLTRYIRDLRISSVFLTWNLRRCPPMFARSALYAIRVYAVLRCYRWFLRSLRSPYVDNARNMSGRSVMVHENIATIAFIGDFPLPINIHMTHAGRMFRACTCNTYVSLTKILMREPCAINTQFISNSAQIMRYSSRTTTYSPCLGSECLCAGVHGFFSDACVIFPYYLRNSA